MLGTLVNIDLLSAQRPPNMFAGRWALSKSNERSIKSYLRQLGALKIKNTKVGKVKLLAEQAL